MTFLLNLVGYVLLIGAAVALILLFVRMAFDWFFLLVPEMRYNETAGRISNLVLGYTEPFLGYLRQFLPPLRLGGLQLDMGFVIAVIILIVLRRIASFLISM